MKLVLVFMLSAFCVPYVNAASAAPHQLMVRERDADGTPTVFEISAEEIAAVKLVKCFGADAIHPAKVALSAFVEDTFITQNKRIYCPICYLGKSVSQMRVSNCDHLTCEDCLVEIQSIVGSHNTCTTCNVQGRTWYRLSMLFPVNVRMRELFKDVNQDVPLPVSVAQVDAQEGIQDEDERIRIMRLQDQRLEELDAREGTINRFIRSVKPFCVTVGPAVVSGGTVLGSIAVARYLFNAPLLVRAGAFGAACGAIGSACIIFMDPQLRHTVSFKEGVSATISLSLFLGALCVGIQGCRDSVFPKLLSARTA